MKDVIISISGSQSFAQETEDMVELVARDDGRGSSEIKAGNGLTGMRERLEVFGGSLDIETRPGYGFVVLARLPLESKT